MTAATLPPPVQVSPEAERTLVFWASPDDAMLLEKYVAAVTGLSSSRLGNMRVDGIGPPWARHGQRVWYRKGGVVAWINERQNKDEVAQRREE